MYSLFLKGVAVTTITFFLISSCEETSSNPPPSQINILSVIYNLDTMTVVWEQSTDTDFRQYDLLTADLEAGMKDTVVTYYDAEIVSHSLSDFDPRHETWFWIATSDILNQSTISEAYMVLENPPTPSEIRPIAFNHNNLYLSWPACDDDDFMSYSLFESNSPDMTSQNLILSTLNVNETRHIVYNVDYDERRYFQLITTDYWELSDSSSIQQSGFSDYQIVYTRENQDQLGFDNLDVFIMNIDGSGKQDLTNSSEWYCYGTPSPNGSTIVYASGYSDILSMNPDGSGQTTITSTSLNLTWGTPRFSPFGTHLIVSSRSYYGGSIFLIDLSNNQITEMTEGINALFSPDGSRIVYTVGGDSFSSGTIYVMDIEEMTSNTLTGGRLPQFTPNGDYIVYISDGYIRDGIGQISIDGNQNTEIIPVAGDWDVYYFAISPDGSKIAFFDWSDIYLVNFDGSDAQLIYDGSDWSYYGDQQIEFSPDGDQIVFTICNDTDYCDMYIMNIDGSGLMNLTNSPTTEANYDAHFLYKR